MYRYPGQEIPDREGCYPEDTAQTQYEISADVRSIIREEVERRFGSDSGSGSGSGSTGTPSPTSTTGTTSTPTASPTSGNV